MEQFHLQDDADDYSGELYAIKCLIVMLIHVNSPHWEVSWRQKVNKRAFVIFNRDSFEGEKKMH